MRIALRLALTSTLLGLLVPQAPAQAQEPPALTITVLDPSGALIVGARVVVSPAGTSAIEAHTGSNGAARIEIAAPGRVNVRVESDGFEPADIVGLQVQRPARRTVKLKLAKMSETVQVGRDPGERASDPRGDVFATVLGA